jgi:hypothetical protein
MSKLSAMSVVTTEHNQYVQYLIPLKQSLIAMQYWDWGRYASDPESSPIFDGSDTSMGGNGKKITHAATFVGPAQNGGGCVEKGPFAKYVSSTRTMIWLANISQHDCSLGVSPIQF